MIRFMPDTWLEAVVRPIAMGVPAGGIYAEIIAPDFRFVFVLALLMSWLAYRIRAQKAAARTLGLASFCVASFVPWLATTGNGRYFMPTLFVVGPLCIALTHHLPIRQVVRLGLAACLLIGQVFLLFQVQPWNYWGLASWKDAPAFAVDVPNDLRNHPATYVTLTAVSYSLMAPLFHPASRWVNISSQQGRPADSPDRTRVRSLLDAAPVVYAIFPSLKGALADTQPPTIQSDAIDLILMEERLRLDRSRCRILSSAGLTKTGARAGQASGDEQPRGFWVCRADTLPSSAIKTKPKPSPAVEMVFNRVEQMCPRMFPPGSAGTLLLPVGARRYYTESDMRLYVLDDGRVIYKYMRALNAVVLGRKEDVLAQGFQFDCENIRGRAGLPWNREI